MTSSIKEQADTIYVLGQSSNHHLLTNYENAKLVITFDLETEFEAKRINIPAIYIHRFAQSKQIWESILNLSFGWLREWPNEPIFKEKSMLEIFQFEKIPLWWFVYDHIWETKNGIFDSLYYAISFPLLFKTYKPKTVEIIGRFDFPVLNLFNSLAHKYDFSLKTDKFTTQEFPESNVNKFQYKILFLIRILFLKIVSSFARKKKVKMVFFSTSGVKSIKKNRSVEINSDHYLEGLEEYMGNNMNKIKFISHDKSRLSSMTFRSLVMDCKKIIKNIHKPWVCYYSIKDLIRWRKLTNYYSKKIRIIEQDPYFNKSFIVDGINFYPLVRDVFLTKLPRSFALVHLEINTARKFLKKENPKLIFTLDGISLIGRALCLACNEMNIKLFSPQLGIISPQAPVNTGFYIDEKFDKRLLPYYLVWGTFYEDLIQKRGYPKELIKKVGFWREQKKDIKSPINKNYILYIANANVKKLDYIQSINEELFTIKKIHEKIPSGYKLIIKLSPILPKEFYFKELENLNNTMVISDSTPTLNELIEESAIVISKASTVTIQALILNKPVIAINFASELDFLGIKDIPFVTTPEQFSRVLSEILNGKYKSTCDLNFYCDPIGSKSVSLIINEIENHLHNFKDNRGIISK